MKKIAFVFVAAIATSFAVSMSSCKGNTDAADSALAELDSALNEMVAGLEAAGDSIDAANALLDSANAVLDSAVAEVPAV
ncbi:MAG: hypothetical protein KBT39_06300 [Bacteroidales bacterium]|nr:hypothetical protein [Bacteroidales bacterium]